MRSSDLGSSNLQAEISSRIYLGLLFLKITTHPFSSACFATTEKFAVCKVGGVTVNVSAENVAEGDSVCLAPDYNKLSVYDTAREILLV